MFDNLSDKFQGVFGNLGRRGTLSEKDLDAALRELRLALLEADVHYKVARNFVNSVREQALTEDVLKSITPTQQVIQIVNNELVRLLGGEAPRLHKSSQTPTVIMVVGLQGAGKTTTCAKLAVHLRRGGDRSLLIAADIYRPAAVEQLRQLGKQLDLTVYDEGTDAQPVTIVEHGIAEAKRIGVPIVIVDTAGRLHIDDAMMDEIQHLKERFKPSEVLLVADAMAGQDAVNAAQAFHDAVDITGVILTKIDGDARGGAALSIRAVTGTPIKFLGTGERADALEAFHPDRLASRILGQGDMATLIERAKTEFEDQDTKKLQRKMQDGSFGLDDFLEQFQKVSNMGPLSQILGMIPGLGAMKKQLDMEELDDSFFFKVEAIVRSMTPGERRKPEIINGSRRRRIATGSGTTSQDVNQLLNQFREAKKIMKAMAGGRRGQMMIPGVRR